jgi:hypothetical protein
VRLRDLPNEKNEEAKAFDRSRAAETEPKKELFGPIEDGELKTEAERIEQRKPTKTSPRAENKQKPCYDQGYEQRKI